MPRREAKWLKEFAADAGATDQFDKSGHHVELLALGLMGEAGSVLAEVKKRRREGSAYPALRLRVREEIGDFLWYYVRLVSLLKGNLPDELSLKGEGGQASTSNDELAALIRFGAAVGDLLHAIGQNSSEPPNRPVDVLNRIWTELVRVSQVAKVPLNEAATANITKRANRWPRKPSRLPLFDQGYPVEEQLPRRMEIEFLERMRKGKPVVILRSMGLNIGDRLTDNIEEADEYRYHDVFHFGYAAFLGWSPVTRGLLRSKRKSRPHVDENEDGGRAQVIEEAISALVFSRAKELRFFDRLDHLDFELLKNIQELVKGYEVERVPLWQWERAILRSYEVFRRLKAERGGRVAIDLHRRRLDYISLRR